MLIFSCFQMMFIVSLAKFCATLLMIGDMVTDMIATYSRFLRCSSGEISCVFFWSTLIVLLISWILAIVLAVQKRNIIGAEMFWTLIFYPFTLPVYSMALTWRALLQHCKAKSDQEIHRDSAALDCYMVVEHIGGALPQLIISFVLINTTEYNKWDTISAVLSVLSFNNGLLKACSYIVCHTTRNIFTFQSIFKNTCLM